MRNLITFVGVVLACSVAVLLHGVTWAQTTASAPAVSRPASRPAASRPALPAKAEPKADPNAPLGSPTFAPSPERPAGWRGDGTGRFPGATPPTKWGRVGGARPESSGVVWMAPVPAGGSSPIVVGDRIFFAFDPYGLICINKTNGHIMWYRTHHYYEVMPDDQRKKIQDKAQPLYAKISGHLDAEMKRMADSVSTAGAPDGKRFMDGQWSQQVAKEQKELDAIVQEVDATRYKCDRNIWEWASGTPVSDGKYVYMWFANHVAVCYDLDGNRQWVSTEPGTDTKCGEHGRHSSGVLVGDKYITQFANLVLGFDRKTGKLVWTATMKAPHWATPTYSSLVTVGSGANTYVVSARGEGFRASDGELGWAPFKDYAGENTTAIVEKDRIFLWDRSGLIQLQIPGSVGPNAKPTVGPSLRGKDFYMVASPLFVDGLVYFVSDKALLRVLDPASGNVLYEKQLPLDAHIEYVWFPGISASPALAGKYIYITDNQGGTVIIEPGKEYKEVAVNKLVTLEKKDKGNNVNEQTVANLWFEGKVIFLRGQQYLYCIGGK